MNNDSQTIQTYRITIECINKEYIKETKTCHFDKKTGEEVTWSKYYNNNDEEKDLKYASHEVDTGKVSMNERSEKVYEQEKSDLDVGELAMFINRSR